MRKLCRTFSDGRFRLHDLRQKGSRFDPPLYFSPPVLALDESFDPAPPLRTPSEKSKEKSSTGSDLLSMADDEPVDPKKYLEDRCKPKCVKALFEYQACIKRVQDDETGHKHCTGQYFDYWSCIDKCVATKLFEKLK